MSLGKVPNGDFIILLVIWDIVPNERAQDVSDCLQRTIDEKAAKEFKEKIEDEYRVNM